MTPATEWAVFQMSGQGLVSNPAEANAKGQSRINTLMLMASPMAAPTSWGCALVAHMRSKTSRGRPCSAASSCKVVNRLSLQIQWPPVLQNECCVNPDFRTSAMKLKRGSMTNARLPRPAARLGNARHASLHDSAELFGGASVHNHQRLIALSIPEHLPRFGQRKLEGGSCGTICGWAHIVDVDKRLQSWRVSQAARKFNGTDQVSAPDAHNVQARP